MDLSAFNHIESKHHLLQKSVNGYFFWVYLRTDLKASYVLEIGNLQKNCGHQELKKTFRIKARLKQIKNIILKGRIPKGSCKLLVLNHPRKISVDGVYECIYTEDIVKNIPNAVVLEEPYGNSHFQTTATKRLMYTDIVDFYSFLYCTFQKYFFSNKYRRIKEIMLEEIRKPIEELNEAYGGNINAEQFENNLIFGYYLYKTEYAYYKRIIEKLKPKAIVEVVSYNRKCMTVNEIAKKLGIPTVEMQHGVLGEEHIAYQYPEGSKIPQFPDYVFTFSEYWSRKTRMPIPDKCKKATGYPYLEKMAGKYAGALKDQEKKTILFLSSAPIGNRLVDIAVKLQKLLGEKEYHIIFKLHPNEYAGWRECYPELAKSGLEVIDDGKTNLYYLFSVSDIQVSGFNSTTIFEGLYFNLPTYVLNYCVLKEIAELCENGTASYFDTAEELADLIRKDAKNKMHKTDICLWETDSLNKVLTELRGIMEQE